MGYTVWHITSARSWPEANGRIESLQKVTVLNNESSVTDPDHIPFMPSMYNLSAKYSYKVGQDLYVASDQIVNLGDAGKIAVAESKCRAGSAIPVHYRPDNPKDSLIEIDSSRYDFAKSAAIGFSIAALFLYVFYRSSA